MAAYETTTGTGSSTSSKTGARTGELQGYQDTARGAAAQAERAGREVAEGMRHVAGNFQHAFQDSLRDRPMATIGMVAFAGFVLGAIWKR